MDWKGARGAWAGICTLLVAVWVTATEGSDINTLMGVRGRDFVLLGGDSAFFRSMVVMDKEYRKVVELDDTMLVAASGEQGDVEMFVEWLKRNLYLMRLEASHPVGVRTLANFARRSLAAKLRRASGGGGGGGAQAVSVLLGGWDEAAGQAELFWLDPLGSLQSVPFGAHGVASRFALGLLDSRYHEGLSVEEARDLLEGCFRQLEGRYLVSSVGFSMKVVDRHGCRDVPCAPAAAGGGDSDSGGGLGAREGGGRGAGGGGLDGGDGSQVVGGEAASVALGRAALDKRRRQ